MRRILKVFQTLGDAAGLVLLLGGLIIATNNARAPHAAHRKSGAKKSVRALNARRAGAAV
ncbi:hypothetical protein [Hyphococcus luteus]|uniref:hypothetical protein n=1 Tax=Hyphococcus luteus TaxID=2058213 RepID=UPI0010573F63|nr:hypothetical protein [Marinicaulis flavus]